MAKIEQTALDGVLLVTPRRFGDDRGYFSETYNKRVFEEAGLAADFIQDNQSFSRTKGTVRGLHYQAPPYAQAKLVRVVQGAVMDIAVDARKGSPSFGKHVSAVLSADNGAQLFVPEGFLHGFATLEADTLVIYKVNNYYNADADGSVRWNDPDLGLDWGIGDIEATLSQKDAAAPSWSKFQSPF